MKKDLVNVWYRHMGKGVEPAEHAGGFVVGPIVGKLLKNNSILVTNSRSILVIDQHWLDSMGLNEPIIFNNINLLPTNGFVPYDGYCWSRETWPVTATFTLVPIDYFFHPFE
jgi:hypothetical protein